MKPLAERKAFLSQFHVEGEGPEWPWPGHVATIRLVPVTVPCKRCSAPGCGDKIKPTGDSDLDKMYEIRVEGQPIQYVEQGQCEEWYRHGHPDHFGGVGLDLKRSAELGVEMGLNKMDDVLDEIKNERFEQITKHGFTTEHDDQYTDGELAASAACYVAPNGKPGVRRHHLIIAAALIVAEIERLDRQNETPNGD